MRYDDPTLREFLSGQYVLGALHGMARARFEELLRHDASLRTLVRAWENVLTPLAEETRPVKPPTRVYVAIQRRLDTGAGAAGVSSVRLWERLGFWRAFSAVGAVAVVVLALITTFVVLRPPAAVPPSYVAVIQDQAAQPVMVVTAFKGPWRLNIEPLAVPALAADKVMQVWAVEKDTGVMRPLVAFAPGKPQQLALTEAHWKLVKSAHSLAVSVEAAGSAPSAPSSPILYSGLCLNLKGV
jgi:anti-sigma-K factor RskA